MSEEIAVAEVSTPAPEPVAVETTAEMSMDDTLAATFEAMKARRPEQGEDGKFQAKAGADTATPKLEVPGSPVAAAPEPALPAIDAPQSLPDDVKKAWPTLPRAIQEVWSKREGETHAKITADGERLKSLGAFEELSTALQGRLQQVGAPAPEYFRRLASADELLVRDGPAGLRQIAQMYGIDPRVAFGQPTQGQPIDPQYSALSQELSAIKSTLTAQQQAQEQARLAEVNRKIEAFKPSAPHFDKVEDLMVALYGTNPNASLEELYGMATRAHPEVSKLIASEQEAKAKAEAAEKLKEEQAKAAKLATLSRKPGSVGTVAKAGGSWEDSMAATFRSIRARG